MNIVKFHSKKSDLVMHINNQVGTQRQHDIKTALEEKNGVVKAEFAEKRPHLIHISYDPDKTTYIEILERLCMQNVQAQRVG